MDLDTILNKLATEDLPATGLEYVIVHFKVDTSTQQRNILDLLMQQEGFVMGPEHKGVSTYYRNKFQPQGE